MDTLSHVGLTALFSRSKQSLFWAALPDLFNAPLLFFKEELSEDHPAVRASRIAHSPLIVVALVTLTKGKAWPYALHWLVDISTHDPAKMLWPFAVPQTVIDLADLPD